MRREQSQQIAGPERSSDDCPSGSGILYVVGVPIGHSDDITLRALRVLRGAALIASEDPIATRLLLAHHGIETTLTSYGPVNLKEKVAVLLHRLEQGARIAIVSDSGSPVIFDPGCLLVAAAHSHGIRVISVPGPSALTAAVAVSGLSGDSFFFQGRLPRTHSAITRCLVRLLKTARTTVAFCPPASLSMALDTIAQAAPRRIVVVACDLTKPGETTARGTARQVRRMLDRGLSTQDATLIIAGRRMQRSHRGRRT